MRLSLSTHLAHIVRSSAPVLAQNEDFDRFAIHLIAHSNQVEKVMCTRAFDIKVNRSALQNMVED